jgi:membrane protein
MSTPSASHFDPRLAPAPESQRSKPEPARSGWSHRLRVIGSVVKETAVQWDEDQASRLAASLALYTLLSIAPLLILSIAIAGMAFGEEAARGQIGREIATIVGPQAGAAIEALVANARAPEAGIVSSIVGIAVLLFGASGVFGELQTALNQIWNVKPKPGRGVRGFIRDRFFSFSMVMGVAFLLLVSLVVSAALALLTERFSELIPLPALWQVANLLVGIAVTTVLFALIFKIVPDAKIAWRDVWVGAFVTAVLFTLGKGLLGWYVGRSATVSPFGAAGSLVALVVWVYYSAQILFFGAEFTQVYATRFGSAIVPTDNAVPADSSELTTPRPVKAVDKAESG